MCAGFVRDRFNQFAAEQDEIAERIAAATTEVTALDREAILAQISDATRARNRFRATSLGRLTTQSAYSQNIGTPEEPIYKVVRLDELKKDFRKVVDDLQALLAFDGQLDLESDDASYANLLKAFLKFISKKKSTWLEEKIGEHEALLITEGKTLIDFVEVLLTEYMSENQEAVAQAGVKRRFFLWRWIGAVWSKLPAPYRAKFHSRKWTHAVDGTILLPMVLVNAIILGGIITYFIMPAVDSRIDSKMAQHNLTGSREVQQIFQVAREEFLDILTVIDLTNRNFRHQQARSGKEADELWDDFFSTQYLNLAQRMARIGGGGSADPEDGLIVSIVIQKFTDDAMKIDEATSSMDEETKSAHYGTVLARTLFVRAITNGSTLTQIELDDFMEPVEDYEAFNSAFHDEIGRLSSSLRGSVENTIITFPNLTFGP